MRELKIKTIEELENEKQNKAGIKYDAILGMSGGVDSTTSLIRLLDKGYSVLGIYLHLFDDINNTSLNNAKKAHELAERFNIDFVCVDARDKFRKSVQEYFVQTYLEGETPNPCAICNREIKMNILTEVASLFDSKYVCTGHYAGVGIYKGDKVIVKGEEPKKEQSYFLALIKKEFLDKLYFPLSDVKDKNDLREFLKEKGIYFSSHSDSQDICFIQNGKHAEFANEYIKEEGKKTYKTEVYLNNVKVDDGKNIFNYTIGKRKGLGIAYTEPLYVKEIEVDKNAEKNKIILDIKKNMYEKKILVTNLNLFVKSENLPKDILVKTRYTKSEDKAIIKNINLTNNTCEIEFSEPVLKPAKGQVLAIYDGKYLLGGGLIS